MRIIKISTFGTEYEKCHCIHYHKSRSHYDVMGNHIAYLGTDFHASNPTVNSEKVKRQIWNHGVGDRNRSNVRDYGVGSHINVLLLGIDKVGSFERNLHALVGFIRTIDMRHLYS